MALNKVKSIQALALVYFSGKLTRKYGVLKLSKVPSSPQRNTLKPIQLIYLPSSLYDEPYQVL